MNRCRFRPVMRLFVILLGSLLIIHEPLAQGSSTPSPSGQAELSMGSRSFRLYQESMFEDVRYYVDGTYTVQPHELVVTIQAGPVVAHQNLVLHALRLGLCGVSNVFLREFSLNDASLRPDDSYRLPAETIRIPLPKDSAAPSWLCSALVESNGQYHIARDKGRPILTPPGANVESHAAHGKGPPTLIPSNAVREPRAAHQIDQSMHISPLAMYEEASEAWKHQNPSDWSQSETQFFLTKSPWVNYFGNIRIPSDVVAGVDKFGRRQVAFVAAPDVAIRWESAPLMRDALVRIESREYLDALAEFSKDYYVIAVIHLMKPTSQAGLKVHWTPEQEYELRVARAAQAVERGTFGQSIPMQTPPYWEARQAFLSSCLLMPTRKIVSPSRVESGENAEGRVDLLMFPRDLALETGEGVIGFRTISWAGMGRSTLSVRFSLKRMAEGSECGL